jgi:hypothetical protein
LDEKNMKNNYSDILDHLYETYLSTNSYSEVTSSHWKEVGAHSVTKENGKFNYKGSGFGNFRNRTLKQRARSIIEVYLTNNLINQYSCSNIIADACKDIAESTNRIFEFDCAKQALSLQFILNNLESPDLNLSNNGIKSVCIIGDGYGFMGNLIKKFDPDVKVYFINLGKTLFFDCIYTQMLHPNSKATLYTGEENVQDNDFIFIEAENYEILKSLDIDLFINIASMQEMNNETINNYFRLIESSKASKKYFYCCNRVEKKLPDGEITKIDEYPWSDNWTPLIDELCPWYQKYPYANPPFWKAFDGPIKHRLARYSSH